jgi:Uncharacterised nucleotidyltransferase
LVGALPVCVFCVDRLVLLRFAPCSLRTRHPTRDTPTHMSHFQQQPRRPEVELLLACARTRMEPAAEDEVKRLIRDGLDWNCLVEAATRHGIVPLLFQNLSRVVPNQIPEAILKQLKGSVEFNTRWNLYVTGELLHLLKHFASIGVRALPFKGPVLAASVYGDLSLRRFSDLDILMAKEDIPRAKDVLLERGYKPALQLNAADEHNYLKTHHDYKFSRSDAPVIVELQWNVTEHSFAFPLNFDDIWQRCGKFVLAGLPVANMRPEDTLLVLCVHGAKHRWERLIWICDIAEIVSAHRDTIAWDRLMLRAHALGGKRMLLLGLSLAHDLLDANLPIPVLKAIQCDSPSKFLFRKVTARTFLERYQKDALGDELPFFYFKVRERFGDKLAIVRRYFSDYFFRMIMPNVHDQAFVGLPRSLSLGYYLIRPMRLAKDYWLGALSRSRTEE